MCLSYNSRYDKLIYLYQYNSLKINSSTNLLWLQGCHETEAESRKSFNSQIQYTNLGMGPGESLNITPSPKIETDFFLSDPDFATLDKYPFQGTEYDIQEPETNISERNDMVTQLPNHLSFASPGDKVSGDELNEIYAADKVQHLYHDVVTPTTKSHPKWEKKLKFASKTHNNQLKKWCRWTDQEDMILNDAVANEGQQNWKFIAQKYFAGKRKGIQCKNRWRKVSLTSLFPVFEDFLNTGDDKMCIMYIAAPSLLTVHST